jgi:signal transduction histidine kinase
MNNVKKYWIISGTLAFVILFAFLIVEIYTSTLEGEKDDYKLQQMEMAKNAASGINYFIDHLASDLRFLAAYPEIQNPGKNNSEFTEELFRDYNPGIVHSVFFTDTLGNIIHSAGKLFPHWAQMPAKKGVASFNKNDTYIITDVSRDDNAGDNSRIYFQLLVPVTKTTSGVKSTSGYLGYLIDFNSLIDQYIKPLKLSKEDFAWILDGSGRLIYHPHHEEMLFFSINNISDDCYSCHVSFDIQHAMINSDAASSGEYMVINEEPAKVMAYYPLIIQDQKWVIVISAAVTKVTENLRSRFRIFFILGFVIFGVIIFFSLIIYFVNLKRIRAEEARKNIEQVQVYREQLNQASKMASIGELVDSVAHEVNTPAGIIAAHVDGMILSEKYPAEITDVLQVVKKQTQRISDYTRSLLNYSQRMAFNPEPTDLKHLIDECVYLLGHRFRAKQVNIIKNYDEKIEKVCADYRQAEQVFINIINNAVDASYNNSTITITIKNCTDKKDGVQVIISDEGTGIEKEDIDKIFNAFYSTKKSSNGTGLGLSIAKAIMLRHKGSITAESKKGSGTIFRLVFPPAANKEKS